MTRVAFPLNFQDFSWMGGINYFRNLFQAIHLAPDSQVQPIIVAGSSADKKILESLDADEISIHKWGNVSGWRWKVRRLQTLGLDRDFVFEKELVSQDISLFSHMGYLGKKAAVPSLPWIPDFQERYLPEFFSSSELAAREKENKRVAHHSTAVLLSSEYAREGLAEISQRAAKEAYVLPFVASVPRLVDIPGRNELEEKYGELGHYFFLPNQFWAHKNHEVVLRALGNLVRRNEPVTVIATGNPNDHRQPAHGRYLKKIIEDEKIESVFRILGMIPYKDLMGLLAHSIALVNPSLFEGWSTTVEEAKSLGKKALISDIPVHREQNPSRVKYFDPHKPEELAEMFLDLSGRYNEETELQYMQQAELVFPERRNEFAMHYEKIVASVIN